MPPEHAQRMTGDDRRRQLIEVAVDLFSKKGFGGTTTKEIATAAGVTEAIIFRHFATKQDLYQAILDTKCNDERTQIWFAGLQVLMAADDDVTLFRFLIEKILQVEREDPKFCRLLLHASLEGNELALMHNTQLAMPIGAKFKEYIARRQAAGALRNINASVMMLAIAGIPKFYAMQKYLYCNRNIDVDETEVVEGFVEILMNGLRRV